MTDKYHIGAHVSAAGGADTAMTRARAIGAVGVQLFSGSPRVWKRTPLSDIDFDKVNSEKEKNNIKSVFIHSIYLINLTAESPELLAKSRETVQYDLAFGSRIGARGIVVHLGSHQGRGWDAVKENLAVELKNILANYDGETKLLIENSAGQNGKLCSDLAEVKWLLDTVASPKLGWCLDTCHAFAAGYMLGQALPEATPAKAHLQMGSLAQQISQLSLWSDLECVHVNDSRDPFGSGRDRHENIGDGEIPTADLKAFLNVPELTDMPFILEVPGIDGSGPDAENVRRLQSVLAGVQK